MKKSARKTPTVLALHRETLHRLCESDFGIVRGAAPTKAGLQCTTFSDPSLCATCLCTR